MTPLMAILCRGLCENLIFVKKSVLYKADFLLPLNNLQGVFMSKKNKRRKKLLAFIRRRSGRRFIIKVMAKEFGVSERTLQADLRFLEAFGQIKRTPSYNALHRQNGNIIVYTGSRRRCKINESDWLFEG